MSERALSLRDVSFAYPGGGEVLSRVSVEIPAGAFALLVGATGSGKTTLLRLCKAEIAPVGERAGEICVFGRELSKLGLSDSSQAVGYVFQNPRNQIVCDSVWHELAFGLENAGLSQQEMRLRIAETCYFLGIEPWFRRKTAELSGGQQQVLALAGVLVMRPRLLLLDEPLAMLDPVAGKSFLALLERAHRELGITVVVATHNPRELEAFATQAFVVEAGAVREAPLAEVCAKQSLGSAELRYVPSANSCIQLRDAWLRYTREGAWVLRGLSMEVAEGEARALVGGNGCGKSTILQLVARVLKPQRGRLTNRHATSQALLPQDPKALLACETVGDELTEWMDQPNSASSRKRMGELLERMGLSKVEGLLARHPLDLSGGQQQLLALCKLVLAQPRLLLLDEPTKGLDLSMRRAVLSLLADLRREGLTLVVATHDMAFVQALCGSVSLIFDGEVSCTLGTDEFFATTTLFCP